MAGGQTPAYGTGLNSAPTGRPTRQNQYHSQ